MCVYMVETIRFELEELELKLLQTPLSTLIDHEGKVAFCFWVYIIIIGKLLIMKQMQCCIYTMQMSQ